MTAERNARLVRRVNEEICEESDLDRADALFRWAAATQPSGVRTSSARPNPPCGGTR